MEKKTKIIVCPQCEIESSGNYCPQCGAKLKQEALISMTKYKDLISDDRCRHIIEQEAAKAKTGMTATDFLQFAQLVIPGRLPLSAMASISSKVGKTLGVGREDFGFRVYQYPFPYVVLAHLTSLARHSMSVKKVQEVEGQCLIEANIPSTIWNLKGKLETLIISETNKTKVMIEAKIFGQWLDLGKTEQMIDRILMDMEKLSAQFMRKKELKKGGGFTTTV